MLLDSRDNLAQLHSDLRAFIASASLELSLPAEQSGSPAPYETFLPGLRVRKATGPIVLRHAADGWLELSGSAENLLRYSAYFWFPPGEESAHHYPEHSSVPGYLSPSSMSLIIEADSTWENDGVA